MEWLRRAELSDNLGEATEGQLGDVDVLRAVGMASQDQSLDVALALWRLMDRGDGRSLHTVVQGLYDFAMSRALEVDEHSLARVIDHIVNPVCPHCLGRGHPVVEGTPVLHEEDCPHCMGSGHRNPHYTDNERTMAEYLMRLQGLATSAIAKRLAHGGA